MCFSSLLYTLRRAIPAVVAVVAVSGAVWADDARPKPDDAAQRIETDGRVSIVGLKADKDGWIALAPLVDAERDLKDAGWKWDGETADFSAGKPRAYVSIPVRIEGSYELKARVTITRAKEATAISLPIGETRAVVLAVRGDGGNTESPTATIELTGLDPKPEPPGDLSVKIGTEYELSCVVLRDGDKVEIEIRRDDRVLFRWSGDVDKVAQRKLLRGGSVELETAYYTTSRFADLRLKMLAGKAAALSDRQPVQQPSS